MRQKGLRGRRYDSKTTIILGNNQIRILILYFRVTYKHQPHFSIILQTDTKVSNRALLGSLSNKDGDGDGDVTQKGNSHCFKLYRAYSISFSLSNVGKFFWN